VQALRQIDAGELLILERPWGSAGVAPGELSTALNGGSRASGGASKAMLEDGTGKANAETPLRNLLNKLNAAVLPLLLQQPHFFPAFERTKPSHERSCALVDANFRSCADGPLGFSASGKNENASAADQNTKTLEREPEEGTASLFPAISMINHSRSPNCKLLPMTHRGSVVAVAVAARRRLLPLDEVTLACWDDPEAVK